MKKLFIIFILSVSVCKLTLCGVGFSFGASESPIMYSDIDSLENIVDDLMDEEKLNALIKLSEYYIVQNPEKSLEFDKKVLILARELENIEEEIRALGRIGQGEMFLGNNYNALEYFKNASKLAMSHNYKEGYVNSLIATGMVYSIMCRYDSSLEYYHKALKIAEDNNYTREMGISLNNIGIIYASNEEINKSLEYYYKALELYARTGDSVRVGYACANIGLVYVLYKEYNKSLGYFERALNIYKSANNEKRLYAVLNSQGEAYLSIKDYPSAYKNFKSSLDFFEKINDKYGILTSILNIGNYYNQINQLDNSESYFKQGLEIAEELQSDENIKECYKGLSSIYQKRGDYKKAMEYHEKFDIVGRKIFNEKTQKKLAELQTKYESEKKEKEIQLLLAENKIDEKQKIILIIIVITLFILGVLFVYLFYVKSTSLKRKTLLFEKEKQLNKLTLEKRDLEAREAEAESQRLEEEMKYNEEVNHLKQEKFREEIKSKNRELSTTTLLVVNKNGMLTGIKETIEKILGETPSTINKELKATINEIDNSINSDKDWDTFKKHFEGVHTGFFERLMQKFPDMTHNELRLCAYMRINLNTKEIAQMLSISPTSVNQRRYRLRKKLDLDSDTGLVEYMINL